MELELSTRPVARLLLLTLQALAAVAAVSVDRETSTAKFVNKYDAAAKQQLLDYRAQPTFYYQQITADHKATSPTSVNSIAPKSSSGFNWVDFGGDFLSGFFPSEGPYGTPKSSGGFSSDFWDTGRLVAGGFSGSKQQDERTTTATPGRYRKDIQEGSKYRGRGESAEDVSDDSREELDSDMQDGTEEFSGAMKKQRRRPHSSDQVGLWSRDRFQRLRSRQKGKRQESTRDGPPEKQTNYEDQEYRTPYTDHRDNMTDYNYFEDHKGNDTFRQHHYRHVTTTHHFYNASDNATKPYTKEAAYDSLSAHRDSRKPPATNYNVEYVHKDGRYIPIVHRTPGKYKSNFTGASFPDGPNVKHHYYYNEYAHDHRNKSDDKSPIVKHHYHPKEYKTLYHDHRNKTDGYSAYKTGSSNANVKQNYHNHANSTSGPNVKHHHYFKEYHYDEQGRLIDPKKYAKYSKFSASYNTTEPPKHYYHKHNEDEDTSSKDPSGSYSEVSDGHSSSESTSSENYREVTPTYDSDKEDDSSEYHEKEPLSTTDGLPVRSYYHNSNHANHYPTAHPTSSYESSREYDPPRPLTTAETSSKSYYHNSNHAAHYSQKPPGSYDKDYHESQPTSAKQSHEHHDGHRPVGYQVHYRDYGDQRYSSKHVNFDDGFSFNKEKRHGSPYQEGYQTSYTSFPGFHSAFSANESSEEQISQPSYRGNYRTRNVESATAIEGARRPHHLGPEHARSLVSRGNIGYILVDPLGELPTIRIHASLINSHHSPGYRPGTVLPAERVARGGFVPLLPTAVQSGIFRRADVAVQSTATPSSTPVNLRRADIVQSATAFPPTPPASIVQLPISGAVHTTSSPTVLQPVVS